MKDESKVIVMVRRHRSMQGERTQTKKRRAVAQEDKTIERRTESGRDRHTLYMKGEIERNGRGGRLGRRRRDEALVERRQFRGGR